MSFLALRSLRQKLVALVLLTTLVALVVALGAMVAYDLRVYHRGLIDDMNTQAALLGRTSAAALTFDDPRVAQENLGLLRFRSQVGAAAIYTARGAAFARFQREGEARGAPAAPEAEGVRIEARDLLVFKRIVQDGEFVGTVFLRADYEMYDRVLDYAGIAAAVLALALLVAFLMTARMQRIVTHPILDIARIAREVIGRGDYSRRAQKLSEDEVGALVDSFNAMLAEIERRTGALQREVAERARAEGEVLRLNEVLEARVRERTAQLEAANRELEAFCYSVSHDLRAPLRAVDGYSRLLEEEHAARLDAEGLRLLGVVRRSATRMGRLIDDLLAFSRFSRQALERQELDMAALVRGVVAELSPQYPAVRVELGELPGARGDRALLSQVWANLVGNALKYSAKSEAPRVHISGKANGAEIEYLVADNGAGFDMRYAEKLFTVFQRLHREDEFPGTGVGLAIVQRIVARHGGRVWAESELGKGATFFVALPKERLS